MHNLSFFPSFFLPNPILIEATRIATRSLYRLFLLFSNRDLVEERIILPKRSEKYLKRICFFVFLEYLKERRIFYLFIYIFPYLSEGEEKSQRICSLFFFNREMIYTETFHSRFLFLYSLQKTRVKFERSFFEQIERISRKSFRKGKRFDSLRNIVFLYRCVGCVEAGFNEDVGGRRESVELSLS